MFLTGWQKSVSEGIVGWNCCAIVWTGSEREMVWKGNGVSQDEGSRLGYRGFGV